MTPSDLIGTGSILVLLSVLSGVVFGRRLGERRERERQQQGQAIALLYQVQADASRRADENRERLQRMEASLENVRDGVQALQVLLPHGGEAEPVTGTVPATMHGQGVMRP